LVPGDDVHCWNFADGTGVSQIASMVTNNQFVEIRNDLEGLAKDEKRGHANEDQSCNQFHQHFMTSF